MSKELDLIKTSNFNVEFTPAKIELKNADVIKKTVKEIAEHYDKTVYAEDDLDGLLQSHKELNKLRKGLDESRKDVKREFNKPLVIFENEIKGMIKEIDKPLNEIKDMRDDILNAQEQLRADALEDYLNKKVADSGLKIEDIEQNDSWLNKGSWTEKLNPRKPLKEEINRAIKLAIEENKKIIAERALLETYFGDKGMDASGWIAQLDYKEATEIINDYQKKIKQEEKVENTSLEARQKVLLDDKVPEEDESTISLDDLGIGEERYTNTIEVTGTIDQLSKLNDYLITSGIDVRQIK